MRTIEWINDAMFYQIFTMGFVGAPNWNQGEKTSGSRILKVIEWIPHLKNMGVNAVYFGPIFESLSHGYDTSDYYKTDSRLGTTEDFKKVFGELHKNNIRIILDGVFNHVGRGFWAFNDVQNKLEESKYKDWFSNVNFSEKNSAGDAFTYDTWEGNVDLVKLNLKNRDVCDHLLGAVKMWIDEFDIDGLRLDAADQVDKDFFKMLHSATEEWKKDFWLMGEIIHGNYNDWANENMLDSTTNYECWKGIYSSHNDKNYFEIAYALKRQFGQEGIYKNLILYTFLDNHDVNRIGSLLNNEKDLENAYTLMYMMPGVPSIYYGSEWGIKGIKTCGAEADKPIRPELNIMDFDDDNKLIKHIKMLAQIREKSENIRYGNYVEILVRNEQLVFAREYNDNATFICFNVSDNKETISFVYKDKQYDIMLKPHSSYISEC